MSAQSSSKQEATATQTKPPLPPGARPTSRPPLRIGCASGFWGDSSVAAPQLVNSGQIDVLVFDYLAETTMAILAAARAKKPELGYATDFVDVAMASVLPQVMARGIKVVANAGGINPRACADALKALAGKLGLAPKVAVVLGDDVSALMPSLREQGVCDMGTGEALPTRVLSANAYLGAFPIAQALAAGADIVITGRCVDSAVALGPLIHHYGWSAQDFDRLSGGSLAGHIIECGCQATGGLFTDWREVPDWPNMGYPIVNVFEDGSFELTKPAGTGGLLHPACVAEQLLYEIGDPGAYLLPDVVCDWRQVHVESTPYATVRVSGAMGRAPTPTFKVSATQLAGWRCSGMLVIIGHEAQAKAKRTGEAIVARCRSLFQQKGYADFSSVQMEFFGNEGLFGPHSQATASREVMLRLVVGHNQREALELFAREVAPAGTSWSPGTTMPSGGRPAPTPHIKPFAFLLDKTKLGVSIQMDAQEWASGAEPAGDATPPATAAPKLADPQAWSSRASQALVPVPLRQLAYARSGDKADVSNIGLIARKPEYLPLIWAQVTPQAVAKHLAHLLADGQATAIERFHLPGIHAMNLVIPGALAGGGPASPRFDPLGKGMGQILLDMPIKVQQLC